MSRLSFNIQQQKHLIEFQLIAMTSKKPLMICDTFVIFVFRPKVQIIENAWEICFSRMKFLCWIKHD